MTLVLVLVHGAGHTAAVWEPTQRELAIPSLAVDLPGRGSRPADITRVTVDAAADAVAADVMESVDDDSDVVLVGHSVAGTVLPSIAARLGHRVIRLVFIAGITAPPGRPPVEVFLPDDHERVAGHLDEMRSLHRGRTLEELDIRDASAIDSLNFSSQPMQWAGLPAQLPRTFVRCLRDPIQSRDLQARFIATSGAHEVIDIDTGHTPATESPATLATVLDTLATRSPTPT